MKFTLSWLKEHLETEADAAAIADKLTAIGLEVESVEDSGARLKDFIVAYVVSAEKHPNADKLKLCMVDDGSGVTDSGCLRRAQRPYRHEGSVRAARYRHSRQRRNAEDRNHPRS